MWCEATLTDINSHLRSGSERLGWNGGLCWSPRSQRRSGTTWTTWRKRSTWWKGRKTHCWSNIRKQSHKLRFIFNLCLSVGFQGDPGLPGDRGTSGMKGLEGAAGDQGKKGDIGAKGQPVRTTAVFNSSKNTFWIRSCSHSINSPISHWWGVLSLILEESNKPATTRHNVQLPVTPMGMNEEGSWGTWRESV